MPRRIAVVTLFFAAIIVAGLRPQAWAQQPEPSAKFSMVLVPPSQAALADVLKEHTLKAKGLHEKPYAYFYADWCGPCKALRKSLDNHDPLMMEAFEGTYIIQLDADTWGKKLAVTKFTVKAIPVLFELNKDGKPTGRK